MTFSNKVLVPYYLMSCFLYYKKNTNVLSDQEFDQLCHQLIDQWDNIEHPHKKFINKGDLVAQTGFNLKYPKIVQVAALGWQEEWDKKEEKTDIMESEVQDIEDLFI
jgi:hypothetical protein